MKERAEFTSEGALKCPHCDTDYLHQRIATVSSDSENRDWTRLVFDCENCAEDPTLLIYNHKGWTLMVWEQE